MKKSGIELIAQERQEQIVKHGFDNRHDSNEYHTNGQLRYAAAHLLVGGEGLDFYPKDWDKKYKRKFEAKKLIERLKVAGALIAAEIDRLQAY